MVVYHGTAHGNTVVLPEGVQLPEGLEVEVRAALPEVADADLQAREEAFYQQLLATGRVLPPAFGPRVPIEPIQPDEITGTPLSEIISAERRGGLTLEEEVEEEMRRDGILVTPRRTAPPPGHFEPLVMPGEPLSQIIIRERR
jgi:hypothetical protein